MLSLALSHLTKLILWMSHTLFHVSPCIQENQTTQRTNMQMVRTQTVTGLRTETHDSRVLKQKRHVNYKNEYLQIFKVIK